MKPAALLLLCLIQFGCNYSLSKTPLVFDLKEGNGSLEQLPTGTIVTYQVLNSSIIGPKCLECHSSAGGDAGGINLETYANVFDNMALIKSEVASDSMPKNRAKLTSNEKATLFAWIDAGGPKDGGATTPPTPPTPPTPEPPQVEVINYEMVNIKVIQPRCLNCHSEAAGNRGDVNLETYENVAALASVIESEIQSGSMPRPRNKPLTPEQKELILKWIANGSPR